MKLTCSVPFFTRVQAGGCWTNANDTYVITKHQFFSGLPFTVEDYLISNELIIYGSRTVPHSGAVGASKWLFDGFLSSSALSPMTLLAKICKLSHFVKHHRLR